jgi:hypothetical protein
MTSRRRGNREVSAHTDLSEIVIVFILESGSWCCCCCRGQPSQLASHFPIPAIVLCGTSSRVQFYYQTSYRTTGTLYVLHHNCITLAHLRRVKAHLRNLRSALATRQTSYVCAPYAPHGLEDQRRTPFARIRQEPGETRDASQKRQVCTRIERINGNVHLQGRRLNTHAQSKKSTSRNNNCARNTVPRPSRDPLHTQWRAQATPAPSSAPPSSSARNTTGRTYN